MLAALLLVIPLAVCWAVCRIKLRHAEKCTASIPGGKSYPFVGSWMAPFKARDTHDLIKLVVEKGSRYREEGIFREWIGCFLIVGITEPKYIEVIANSPYSVEKGPLMAALLQGYPKGVFATNDMPQWKILRKPLIKSLTRKYLEKEHHGVFLGRNKEFVKHLKEKRFGQEINIKKEFQNLAVDIFSGTHLGVKTNEVEETSFKFLDYVMQFVEESFSVSAFLKAVKAFNFLQELTKSEKMKKAEIFAREFLLWILQERMKRKNVNGDLLYYPDFLLKRTVEQNMPLEETLRELVDVVFAGTDTSAVVLSCALLFLAMHPEIQEKAYQEQVSIFGENPMAEPTPDDLTAMMYLTQVLKETIRYSSPPMILKYATGDIQLDNYTVPKGTTIIIEIATVCFDERYWEKPTEFYPDHFLPEKEAERPTFAYPVFGIGPRICPGIQYAMSSMKTALSFIIRNFRMSTRMKFEGIEFQYNIMREFNSYMVKFEERTRCNGEVCN